MTKETKAVKASVGIDHVSNNLVVIQAIADIYNVSGKKLADKVAQRLKKNDAFAQALNSTNFDRKQASIVGLVAGLEAESESKKSTKNSEDPKKVALITSVAEGLDWIARDTIYSIYWLGMEVQDVVKHQGFRSLTVMQNRTKSLKIFAKAGITEEDLNNWRTRGSARPVCKAKPEELLSAIDSPTKLKKLTDQGAQELVTDALAAAARQGVNRVCLWIGIRSMRTTSGRGAISTPPRLSLYEIRNQLAAEEIAEYERTRNYDITSLDINWGIHILHKYNETGPQDVTISWAKGDHDVVILTKDEKYITRVSKENKNFAMDVKTLPYEFIVRPAGRLTS